MSSLGIQIEEVHTKSEKLRDLQHALYVAIYRQEEYRPEEFEWAFILLDEVANEVSDDLKELIDVAFGMERGKKNDEKKK